MTETQLRERERERERERDSYFFLFFLEFALEFVSTKFKHVVEEETMVQQEKSKIL